MSEPKPWLVVFSVDGPSLKNLKGTDGKPVSPRFDHLNQIACLVGTNNLYLVFTSIPDGDAWKEIDAWLKEHSFYVKTGIQFRNLLFMQDEPGPGVIARANERCKFNSYSQTLFITDQSTLLTPLPGWEEFSTHVLLCPSEDQADVGEAGKVLSFETLEDFRQAFPGLLRDR